MENGASFNNYPNQEDKSGRPTYAAASRNSSTIDPRVSQATSTSRSTTNLQAFFNRLRRIFSRR